MIKIHPKIKEIIDGLKKKQEMVFNLQPDLENCEKVMSSISGYKDSNIWIDTTADICINIRGIENYKEFIVKLLRIFGQYGHKQKYKPHVNGSGVCMTVWLYPSIYVAMYLNDDDDSKCKMVKVA